jgi:hypothetical protein
MVDIVMSEREKTIIGKATALLRLRYGKKASPENIHKYLINHPHPLIQKIVKTINDAANQIKDEIRSGGTWWQRDNIVRMSELGIWCLIHHKRYRRIFENFASSIFDYKKQISFKDKTFNIIETKLIKHLLQYSYKMLKGQWTYDVILEEMENGSNSAMRLLLNKVTTSLEQTIDNEYERRILYDFASTGLWFAQHDTAYRDIFFWILHEIGNDEIKKVVKPFYLTADKWYINIWHDHYLESDKMRKKGELGVFGHDIVEEMAVPEMRNKRLQDIIKGGKK